MNTVHVEFNRVQSWLFSVPRLRAMTGANSLLGRVIREDLKTAAIDSGSKPPHPLPDLPKADPADPLKAHDDPAADAASGILSRDGGHFEACFENEEAARAFAVKAAGLIQAELPGLPFSVSIDETPCLRSTAEVSSDLPILAPCPWTGSGLASVRVQKGDDPPVEVSLDVARRLHAALTPSDLASLLTALSTPEGHRRPDSFEELVGNGYLAVIHADGNSVGANAPQSRPDRAAFFHRNRVLLRRALHLALKEAIPNQNPLNVIPILPLMLGGDDLLVVSRADLALPFLLSLCTHLDQIQPGSSSPFRLTLGAGVVISKATVPFHRLHAVVESLASSAKRLYRSPGSSKSSVVDWAVYTTSWVDDPIESRRRDWIRGASPNLRLLSNRPLPILGDSNLSLQGLLLNSARIAKAPRSQLRYLANELLKGEALAELAFKELSAEASSALRSAGVSDLWSSTAGQNVRTTSFLDLVEIAEIKRLGSLAQPRPAQLNVQEEIGHVEAQ